MSFFSKIKISWSEFISSRVGQNPNKPDSISLVSSSKRAEVASSLKHTTQTSRIPVRLAVGYEVQVVGESFYELAFRKIRQSKSITEGSAVALDAELRTEPNNPNSKSGKAVAVYVLGEKVGHIAELLAPVIHDDLASLGGLGSCGARVYFDYDSNSRRRNSVTLMTLVPITPASSIENLKVPSLTPSSEPGEFELKISQDETQSIISVLEVGESFFDRFNIEMLDEGAEVYFRDESYAGRVSGLQNFLQVGRTNNKRFHYLEGKITRSEDSFILSLFVGPESKEIKVWTGNCVTNAGNVTSQSYRVGIEADFLSWEVIKPFPKSRFLVSHKQSKLLKSGEYLTWAVLKSNGEVWAECGPIGAPYATQENFMERLRGVQDSLVMTSLSVSESGSISEVSICLPDEIHLGHIADRPVQGKVSRKALPRKAPKTAVPTNQFHQAPSKAVTGMPRESDLDLHGKIPKNQQGELVFTGFNNLLALYLEQTASDLGFQSGNSVTRSRTLMLIIDDKLELASSAKARKALGFDIPIVRFSNWVSTNSELLKTSLTFNAYERYQAWLIQMGRGKTPHLYGEPPLRHLQISKGEIKLVPGAALEFRPIAENLNIYEKLVLNQSAKPELIDLIRKLGGQQLDTLLFSAEVRTNSRNSSKAVEIAREGRVIAHLPGKATTFDSRDGSGMSNEDHIVRIDWISKGRLAAHFGVIDLEA